MGQDRYRIVQDYALSRAGVRAAYLKPDVISDDVTIVLTVVATVSKRDWMLGSAEHAIETAHVAIDSVTKATAG